MRLFLEYAACFLVGTLLLVGLYFVLGGRV